MDLKKIKGRKQAIAVDTRGLLWVSHIHAANEHDTASGVLLVAKAERVVPEVKAYLMDQGYRGTTELYIANTVKKTAIISPKIKPPEGVSPKRWVVERTFSWMNGHRRLSKDYELSTKAASSFLFLFNIRVVLRKLNN